MWRQCNSFCIVLPISRPLSAMQLNVKREITSKQQKSKLRDKKRSLEHTYFFFTNYRDKLWKSVRLNSFQKHQLQSILILFTFAVLFKLFFNVIKKIYFAKIQWLAVPSRWIWLNWLIHPRFIWRENYGNSSSKLLLLTIFVSIFISRSFFLKVIIIHMGWVIIIRGSYWNYLRLRYIFQAFLLNFQCCRIILFVVDFNILFTVMQCLGRYF